VVSEMVLTIGDGDQFTVERGPCGELAIRVQDGALTEVPRWVRSSVTGRDDRRRTLDQLIHVLSHLRDALDGEDADWVTKQP
jgi:hypothetical protein